MPVKDEILIPQRKDESFSGDVLPSEDGRWNAGSLTKRWNKLIAKILRVINVEYTGNLKPERGGTVYTGYSFVPVYITHTSFDGDSFSDTGTATKIENTSWSSTIPAEAVALLVDIRIRDSGSAADPAIYFALYPTSAGTAGMGPIVYATGAKDDVWRTGNAIIACADGDVWYKCGASGTSTLEVYLICQGYFI